MSLVQSASDALITMAMGNIRQKAANLRANKLNPKNWCVVLARLDAGNPRGLAFVQRLHPSFVPVGPKQGFNALMAIVDVVEGLAEIGAPPQLVQQIQQAAANVPNGSITVVCSIAEGVTVAHIPVADKDLPPAGPELEARRDPACRAAPTGLDEAVRSLA